MEILRANIDTETQVFREKYGNGVGGNGLAGGDFPNSILFLFQQIQFTPFEEQHFFLEDLKEYVELIQSYEEYEKRMLQKMGGGIILQEKMFAKDIESYRLAVENFVKRLRETAKEFVRHLEKGEEESAKILFVQLKILFATMRALFNSDGNPETIAFSYLLNSETVVEFGVHRRITPWF